MSYKIFCLHSGCMTYIPDEHIFPTEDEAVEFMIQLADSTSSLLDCYVAPSIDRPTHYMLLQPQGILYSLIPKENAHA